MHVVVLKSGREKTVLRHHPWIFSGAISKTGGKPGNGETVNVISSSGEFLGKGAYSSCSQIRTRLWTFDQDEEIDQKFFRNRIKAATELREKLVNKNSNSYRLINAESDGLPGLIVDRYADFLVCQFLSAGVEKFRNDIVTQLQKVLEPAGIYERSDVEVREKEGLQQRSGLLSGVNPPDLVSVHQSGINFLVDIRHGHKTGMYLDQRENRMEIENLAKDRHVLNCFAYTGNFAMGVLRGGAKNVVNIESSAEAINLIEKNFENNTNIPGKYENIKGDVFSILRNFNNEGRKFDMVILDPPKFVNSIQQLKRGCRGYKDINRLAFMLLRENGILVTFSCSGHLSPELFQKIIADAALDAGCRPRIVKGMGQPADHPIALNFPEGRYLKGLVCYI